MPLSRSLQAAVFLRPSVTIAILTTWPDGGPAPRGNGPADPFGSGFPSIRQKMPSQGFAFR